MTVVEQIGFTGTRLGMTDVQEREVLRLLYGRRFWAHHGDCIGADAQFHRVCRFTFGCLGVVGHPPNSDRNRAHCTFDHERAPLPYLLRNRVIVAQSTFLIAAPVEMPYRETFHGSGTWATVRHAREARPHLPIAIVWPNGIVSEGRTT